MQPARVLAKTADIQGGRSRPGGVARGRRVDAAGAARRQETGEAQTGATRSQTAEQDGPGLPRGQSRLLRKERHVSEPATRSTSRRRPTLLNYSVTFTFINAARRVRQLLYTQGPVARARAFQRRSGDTRVNRENLR